MQYLNSGKYEFIIERLYRGSIINHNSFLMDDEMDTDARCANNVSVYFLTIEKLKLLRSKHVELDQALEKQELLLL